MAFKNRYFKNPYGRNNNFSFMAISGQVEYSDSTTWTLFVTESVAGEIGVFNHLTGALISGAGNVTNTTLIFFAINKGPVEGGTVNKIERSEPFRVIDAKCTRSAYAAPVKGITAHTYNSASALAAGDVIGYKILDLTAQGHPMSTFDFEYIVPAAGTFDTAMTALAALITDATSVGMRDRDQLVTASYNTGTNVMTITNADYNSVVKCLPQGKLRDLTIDTTTITKTVIGHGHLDDAFLFEEAMWIRDGVTTNAPNMGAIGANSSDFGRPTSLITPSTIQFNHYDFLVTQVDAAKTVHKVQSNPTCLSLMIASNGGANAEAEIKLIFAL
jgi:hypothetical protein